MSEFTQGLLFRQYDHIPITEAAKQLQGQHVIEQLNERWNVLLPQVTDNDFWAWVRQTSLDAPLLWFYHAEDHGWGYEVFDAGKRAAKCDISYEIEFGMVVDRIEQMMPNRDPMDVYVGDNALTQRLHDEVRRSDAYRARVQQQFKDSNAAVFAAFGFSTETIQAVNDLLNADTFLRDASAQALKFRELINLLPMEWKSYRYAQHDGDAT
jgi:hypothetical protein